MAVTMEVKGTSSQWRRKWHKRASAAAKTVVATFNQITLSKPPASAIQQVRGFISQNSKPARCCQAKYPSNAAAEIANVHRKPKSEVLILPPSTKKQQEETRKERRPHLIVA